MVFLSLEVVVSDWHSALHLANDCAAQVDEYWLHSAGCERWIRLRRDLESHAFTDADAQSGTETD